MLEEPELFPFFHNTSASSLRDSPLAVSSISTVRLLAPGSAVDPGAASRIHAPLPHNQPSCLCESIAPVVVARGEAEDEGDETAGSHTHAGTAGVWRRTCIIDAGNWNNRTTVEDMDLSLRAHLRGWRFLFLDHVEVGDCPTPQPPHHSAPTLPTNAGGSVEMRGIHCQH